MVGQFTRCQDFEGSGTPPSFGHNANTTTADPFDCSTVAKTTDRMSRTMEVGAQKESQRRNCQRQTERKQQRKTLGVGQTTQSDVFTQTRRAVLVFWCSGVLVFKCGVMVQCVFVVFGVFRVFRVFTVFRVFRVFKVDGILVGQKCDQEAAQKRPKFNMG